MPVKQIIVPDQTLYTGEIGTIDRVSLVESPVGADYGEGYVLSYWTKRDPDAARHFSTRPGAAWSAWGWGRPRAAPLGSDGRPPSGPATGCKSGCFPFCINGLRPVGRQLPYLGRIHDDRFRGLWGMDADRYRSDMLHGLFLAPFLRPELTARPCSGAARRRD